MRFDPREANIGIRAFRPLGMKPWLAPRQTNMAGYPIPWKMEDCQTVRRSLIYEGVRISTLFLHERLDSLLSLSGRRSVPLIKIKLHLPSELNLDLGDWILFAVTMSIPKPDGPNIDIGPSMLGICWTLYSIAGLVVVGRVYTQLRISQQFGIGDILMIFAVVRPFSKTNGSTANSSRYLVSLISACWQCHIITDWAVTSSTWAMIWDWRQWSGSS